MVSTRPLISKSSSPGMNPLATLPKAQITIGTIATLMFHSFFNSTARYKYLPFFSHSFSFIVVSQDSKAHNFASSPFLLIIIRSGLLAESRWSVFMSKSYRSLYVSFSRTDAGLCIYHLFVLSNFNFLHISQWITLPNQSCLALFFFYAYYVIDGFVSIIT